MNDTGISGLARPHTPETTLAQSEASTDAPGTNHLPIVACAPEHRTGENIGVDNGSGQYSGDSICAVIRKRVAARLALPIYLAHQIRTLGACGVSAAASAAGTPARPYRSPPPCPPRVSLRTATHCRCR